MRKQGSKILASLSLVHYFCTVLGLEGRRESRTPNPKEFLWIVGQGSQDTLLQCCLVPSMDIDHSSLGRGPQMVDNQELAACCYLLPTPFHL